MSESTGAIILSPRLIATGSPESKALENINTAVVGDGTICYVSGGPGQGEWQLEKGSSAVPDGVTIVEPIAGPGRWFIKLLPGPAAGAVPGAPNFSIQFNNGGAFGGNAGLLFEADGTGVRTMFTSPNDTASSTGVNFDESGGVSYGSLFFEDSSIPANRTVKLTSVEKMLVSTTSGELSVNSGASIPIVAATSITATATAGSATVQAGTQVLLNGVNSVQVNVNAAKTANFTPATTASLAPNRVLADDGTGTGDLVYVPLTSGGGTISVSVSALAATPAPADPGANSMLTVLLTNVAARTFQLPSTASATNGTRVLVKEAANSAAPIAITVSGGGNIDFSAAYNIATFGGSATFQFSSATNQWWVI